MSSTRKSRNKSNKSKPGKRTGKGRFHNREVLLELQLIRTYPKQVVLEAWIPATPIKLTTTVTTGLIANASSVSSAFVSNFATRFGSTFVEYRFIRAKWKLRFFSSNNPGVVHFWVDDKSNAAPTLNEALQRATTVCSAADIGGKSVQKWVCADPLDLQYIAIGAAAVNVTTFKSYTNFTNFGSSIVATDYLEIEPEFQVQFRGLQTG
jgi:hypothetical protein